MGTGQGWQPHLDEFGVVSSCIPSTCIVDGVDFLSLFSFHNTGWGGWHSMDNWEEIGERDMFE